MSQPDKTIIYISVDLCAQCLGTIFYETEKILERAGITPCLLSTKAERVSVAQDPVLGRMPPDLCKVKKEGHYEIPAVPFADFRKLDSVPEWILQHVDSYGDIPAGTYILK